jgi:biotin carboxyl carrier protein
MAEKTLIANLIPDGGNPGTLIIASPVVGYADGAPRKGLFLNPFDSVIEVKILNQRYSLRLPREAHGRIIEVFIPNSYTPLAYGMPIARIDPRALSEEETSATDSKDEGADEATEEAGLIKIKAPTEGIFYRKPSPEAPPFVEVGAEVSTGSVLGLVEVMKCFNQITYGGVGLPGRGVVSKIFVEDTSEVGFGQPLFLIKPVV